MTELITINQPFHTVDDFHRRAGDRLASLIHRLAGKYPQLAKGCGTKRMLLALSVAWALTGIAKEGDRAVFDHIDDALSPPISHGCATMPRGGCVVVEGEPFFIAEGEQAMLRFLWDGFTIFIDHEGTETVGQHFFDFAEAHQSKAYSAMGEDEGAETDQPAAAQTQTFSPAPMVSPVSLAPMVSSDPTAAPTSSAAPLRQQPSPTPQLQAQETAGASDRRYLAEMVEGVVAYGDEQAVRSLLASFGYIPHHDSYIDHLRGVLLGRLEQLALGRQAPRQNHYHFEGDVGQFVNRGDGYMG